MKNMLVSIAISGFLFSASALALSPVEKADSLDMYNYGNQADFQKTLKSLRPDDSKLTLRCVNQSLWLELNYPAMESQPKENIYGWMKFDKDFKDYEVKSILRKKVKDLFKDKKVIDRRIFVELDNVELRDVVEHAKNSRDLHLRLRFKGMVWSDINVSYALGGLDYEHLERRCIRNTE